MLVVLCFFIIIELNLTICFSRHEQVFLYHVRCYYEEKGLFIRNYYNILFVEFSSVDAQACF